MKATIATNISRFEKPDTTIPSQIDATLYPRHDKYPKILEILAIHLLGRQGLALRGHRESMEVGKIKIIIPGISLDSYGKLESTAQNWQSTWKSQRAEMQHILTKSERT